MTPRAAAARIPALMTPVSRPGEGPLAANLALLDQAEALLGQVDDARYTCTTSFCPGGSVGKHLRHALDFYGCFLRGLPGRRLDYQVRSREEAIEGSRPAALRRVGEIRNALARVAPTELGQPLRVRGEDDTAEGGSFSLSTVHRELQFLASHTVHHFALCAVLLRTLGIEPGQTFGVAPSTLRHRAR